MSEHWKMCFDEHSGALNESHLEPAGLPYSSPSGC